MSTAMAEETDADPASAAKAVVLRLKQAGFESYWAGGCVRDLLSGKAPKDYDVATAAKPEEVEALFRRTVAVGRAFGVVRVRCRGHWFEVATFRKDGTYADGRRPDSVVFSSAEEDAGRRDFTINGMFLDPESERVVDFVGGKADLDARLVRAIGDPDARFGEDSLRLLRAIRFAAQEGYALEAETEAAIVRRGGDLARVSPERVREELVKISFGARVVRTGAAKLFFSTGLWAGICGDIARVDPSAAIDAVSRTTLPGPVMFLAGLCGSAVDPFVSKPRAVDFVGRLAERLRLSNEERGVLETLLGDRGRLRGFLTARPARRRLWATRADLDLHLALADAERVDPIVLDAIRAEASTAGLRPAPLLDGGAAMKLGARKGPALGALLRRVRLLQLGGRLDGAENAAAYVRGRNAVD